MKKVLLIVAVVASVFGSCKRDIVPTTSGPAKYSATTQESVQATIQTVETTESFVIAQEDATDATARKGGRPIKITAETSTDGCITPSINDQFGSVGDDNFCFFTLSIEYAADTSIKDVRVDYIDRTTGLPAFKILQLYFSDNILLALNTVIKDSAGFKHTWITSEQVPAKPGSDLTVTICGTSNPWKVANW